MRDYINYEQQFNILKEMLINQNILTEEQITNLIDSHNIINKIIDEDKPICISSSGDSSDYKPI